MNEQAQINQLEHEIDQLRYALAHRPETDRVVGMLMLAGACGPDTAWAALAQVSQDTNRKVRDLAAVIAAQVATGSGLPAEVNAALRRQLLLPGPMHQGRTVSAKPPTRLNATHPDT